MTMCESAPPMPGLYAAAVAPTALERQVCIMPHRQLGANTHDRQLASDGELSDCRLLWPGGRLQLHTQQPDIQRWQDDHNVVAQAVHCQRHLMAKRQAHNQEIPCILGIQQWREDQDSVTGADYHQQQCRGGMDNEGQARSH